MEKGGVGNCTIPLNPVTHIHGSWDKSKKQYPLRNHKSQLSNCRVLRNRRPYDSWTSTVASWKPCNFSMGMGSCYIGIHRCVWRSGFGFSMFITDSIEYSSVEFVINVGAFRFCTVGCCTHRLCDPLIVLKGTLNSPNQ